MADDVKRAVVSGGLGVIGRKLVDHLSERPGWEVVALSRRKPDFASKATYLSLDLLDPAELRAGLAEAGPVTHVFHAAYQEHRDPAAQVSVNLALLANLVQAVEATSPGLERVLLYEGAKYYGVHLGAFPTPAMEDDPRHMPPNFYYDQQDWLTAAAVGKAWEPVVLRPDVVCGFALGNPMNLTLLIAVYAAISKELGMPLKFPGSAECYGRLAQVTDAGQLARASEWAATEAPGGEAYNLTNGDLFRWNRVWPRIARHFGMECGEPQKISLVEVMADKAPVWRRIVEKHGLLDIPYETITAWGFGDFVFNCDFDVISSTTKIRQAGFGDVVDSTEMFLRIFDEFSERRVIPAA